MIGLANLVHTPVAKAVGWTLFHFLWEGVIVAALLAVALAILRTARARYGAACVALVAMLMCFAVTFLGQPMGSSNIPANVSLSTALAGNGVVPGSALPDPNLRRAE